MDTVCLKPLYHRGQESIAINFKNDASLNLIVRKLPAVKWSQTNKCWYLPLNPISYKQLCEVLKGKSVLDNTVLKNYLEKRKQVVPAIPAAPKESFSKSVAKSPLWKLSKENSTALEKFIEQLKLKAYSPSTIRTYRNEFLQLLQLLKQKNINELSTDDLRRYMVYAMEKEGITENTAHSRLNALPRWI
jgi:integrase/recombinase XerD